MRGVREILLHDDLGDERHQPTRCATSLLADIPQREKLPLTLDSKCGLRIAALYDLSAYDMSQTTTFTSYAFKMPTRIQYLSENASKPSLRNDYHIAT